MKATKRAMAPPEDALSDFRLEDFLPYRLSVAANRVSRLFARRYAEVYGLTIPEWRVLATVARFGVLSPTDIGEWTAMDKVKVSRAAATLVTHGLLSQSADPSDGRGRLLRLTRKGGKIHRGMVPMARSLEATLAQGLSRGEWASLSKALQRLNAHVREIEGPDHGEAVD